MKTAQLKRVREQIEKNGYVSRNWALNQRITRLAAHAATLRSEGMQLDGTHKNGDYIYKLQA